MEKLNVTPKEFKARYNNLPVRRLDGTIETVRVNRYVLNHSKWFNPGAMEEFRKKYFSRRIDRDLSIFTTSGEVKVRLELTKEENRWEKRGIPMRFELDNKKGETQISTHDVDWGGFCVYCFLGKGAPEHYQIVLQLAEHWDLAPNGLQAYADSALGLDCNGFVGNYIWYGKKGKAWSKPGFNDLKGPDSIITNFFKGAPAVTRWEDIKSSNTYIFGLVDHTGHVVPGGKGPAGHIMITQAGESSKRLNWDTYNPRLWVVESTAGAINPGLTEGWYECIDYDQKKGVFTLDRGPDIMPLHRQISCKIVQLV
jgi:hypothetical protein